MTDTADSQATAGLVTAARPGDHAAFAGLIQRHYPMVHDWAAFSLDALLEDRVISEPAGTGPDPAEAAAAAEVTRRIKAETAARLRIPASAVKARLHKARAALRASLRDYRPERHTAMTTEMVPVIISGVFRRTGSDSAIPGTFPYVIGLTETGGDRRMWVFVGQAEATALAISLSGKEQPRPLTYQFTAALLAAAGARLREIRISHLADGVFYPQAVLSSGTVVDARPSDALNLAAISDVPVYAAAELLDLHTRNSSSDSPHERTVITAVLYDPPPQPEHE